MEAMRTRVVVWAVAFGLWMLLAAGLDPQEGAMGVIVATLVAALPLPGRAAYGAIVFSPKRLLYALAFAGVFVWAVIKSNLDVALRVLHPRLPINPGIVRVRTRLRSPLGRLILANSITLTPGTITVEAAGEELFVHWISVDAEDLEAATDTIVAGFERYLEVIFG